MGLDYALLAAAFTALVDALPVLGVGAVLIPWAILSLLLGNTGRGLALLALYAVTTLTHSLPNLRSVWATLPITGPSAFSFPHDGLLSQHSVDTQETPSIRVSPRRLTGIGFSGLG